MIKRYISKKNLIKESYKYLEKNKEVLFTSLLRHLYYYIDTILYKNAPKKYKYEELDKKELMEFYRTCYNILLEQFLKDKHIDFESGPTIYPIKSSYSIIIYKK